MSEPEDSPIIDCDVLEAAKENIQPLASGRRVTSLSAVLSTPHVQREAHHASVKSRHRINIELALDDPDADPLGAYCAFVYWTLEAYPQGQSVESGLLELLEEATRVLKDDRVGQWRGELRYLKLWVLYASYVEKPVVVYRFLLANDVGTEHALLYEEYAAVLERDARRIDADEAYTLGIARNAQPLDRLKNKHKEFQKRMMSTPAHPPTVPTPDPPATAAPAPKRTVFGTTRTSTHDDVFTVPTTTTRAPPNARLQVFVDPSPSPSSIAGDDEPTPYPDIGTRKTRIKENVPEVKKAGGTTLRQAGKMKRVASASAAGGAPASRIAVFRDPEASSSKGAFAIFQDSPNAGDMPPPPVPAPARKPSTAGPSKGKAAFAIFQDQDSATEMSSPAVPSSSKAKSFAIFQDSEIPPPAKMAVPCAPPTPTTAFTPFRDEPPQTPSRPSPSHPSSSSPAGLGLGVPESVMKLKAGKIGKGGTGTMEASEAEALRKDPLKNYGIRAGSE